jgi:hypothetical protein
VSGDVHNGFPGTSCAVVEPIAQFVAVIGLVYFGIGVVLTIMHDRHMIERTRAGRRIMNFRGLVGAALFIIGLVVGLAGVKVGVSGRRF